MIIDPYGVPMLEFMDRLSLVLSSFGAIPVFVDGMTWKQWATGVILLPGIAQYHPPDPNLFDEWLQWALEFNKTVMVNVQ